MKSYYVKQRVLAIKDRYDIYENGTEAVYYVKGQFFSLTPKFHIFNHATNEEIYTIKKRFFSFLPHYDLIKDNKVVATVMKKFTMFTHKITVLSDVGNYNIHGDFLAHDFAIELDGVEVANIKKKWFSFGDGYQITIFDDENSELYLALVVMIDNCIHDNKSNNHN